MRRLAVLALLLPSFCGALQLTANEEKYLPVLSREIDKYWKDAPVRSVFAAQVRQETCPSLKSKKCWSPFAELKTDREYGFGLGQITVTKSFDNFREARKLDSSLKSWAWEDRYKAEFQLRTLVLTNKVNYGFFLRDSSPLNALAFMFAAYNGGRGGVLSDRAVCRATLGCSPGVWFGNVERTSRKAKVAANGYGKSFFEINREYVRHICIEYPARYSEYFQEDLQGVLAY